MLIIPRLALLLFWCATVVTIADAAYLRRAEPTPEKAHPSLASALESLKQQLRQSSVDLLIYRSEHDTEPPLQVDAAAGLPLIQALQDAEETFSAAGLPMEFRWHIVFKKRDDGQFLDLAFVYSKTIGGCTLADLIVRDGKPFLGRTYSSGPASWAREAEGIFQEYQLALTDDPKALLQGIAAKAVSPSND